MLNNSLIILSLGLVKEGAILTGWNDCPCTGKFASLWSLFVVMHFLCLNYIHTVYVTYSLYFWDMHVYFHHWSAHSAYLSICPCLKKMQAKFLCECAHLRAHTHTYICLGNFPEIEPSYITAHTRASFRLFGGFLEDTEGYGPAGSSAPSRSFWGILLLHLGQISSSWFHMDEGKIDLQLKEVHFSILRLNLFGVKYYTFLELSKSNGTSCF